MRQRGSAVALDVAHFAGMISMNCVRRWENRSRDETSTRGSSSLTFSRPVRATPGCPQLELLREAMSLLYVQSGYNIEDRSMLPVTIRYW